MFTQRELILKQMKWFELLRNYDMSNLYYLGKANMVGDALSRLSMGSTTHLEEIRKN